MLNICMKFGWGVYYTYIYITQLLRLLKTRLHFSTSFQFYVVVIGIDAGFHTMTITTWSAWRYWGRIHFWRIKNSSDEGTVAAWYEFDCYWTMQACVNFGVKMWSENALHVEQHESLMSVFKNVTCSKIRITLLFKQEAQKTVVLTVLFWLAFAINVNSYNHWLYLDHCCLVHMDGKLKTEIQRCSSASDGWGVIEGNEGEVREKGSEEKNRRWR